MAQPMEYVKELLLAEKGSGEILAASSAWLKIQGAEEITLSVTTGSLPMVRNGQIEWSSPTGLKMAGIGKNQTKNDIQITVNERDTMSMKKAINQIMLSGRNGNLEVEFWIGDGEHIKSQLWGKAIAGMIIYEDAPEFDAEGTETPMKHSFVLSCHYFPENCDVDEASRGIAANTLDKLETIEGLEGC